MYLFASRLYVHKKLNFYATSVKFVMNDFVLTYVEAFYLHIVNTYKVLYQKQKLLEFLPAGSQILIQKRKKYRKKFWDQIFS